MSRTSPYIHENILGTREHTEIVDYDVTTDAYGVVASNVKVYQPDPYGTGEGETVVYTYAAPRPLTAYLLKESAGPQFSILLVITPHSPVESTAWMWMTMNYGHDLPEQELIDWAGLHLPPRTNLSSNPSVRNACHWIPRPSSVYARTKLPSVIVGGYASWG